MMLRLLCTAAVLLAPSAWTNETPPAGEGPILVLVENAGQWDRSTAFAGRFGDARVRLGPSRVELRIPGTEGPQDLRLVLEEPGPEANPEGRTPLPGRIHFLRGNDPERWTRGVRRYASAFYRNVRPGVDLEVHSRRGPLELDLRVAAGHALGAPLLRIEGADATRLEADGGLRIQLAEDVVRLPAPAAWEVTPEGEESDVECSYLLRDGDRLGFRVEGRDPSRPLVIDPKLLWSSYLGGSSWESAYAADVDPGGAVTVTGQTGSMDFPVTSGAFDTDYNGVSFSDVFVTRVAADGTLLWSTYLGGINGEEGCAVAVSDTGEVTVAGVTASSDFPTTAGALDGSLDGSSDAFVARLSADGSTLLASTLLGGGGGDVGRGVAIASDGDMVVAGTTDSGDFPTTAGAFDTGLDGTSDAFVARISSDGATLVSSTLLGGGDGDTAEGVALGTGDEVLVAGATSSSDFPTTAAAHDQTLDGKSDAFVARLTADLSGLDFGTYLGGSAGDVAEDVRAAGDGGAWACGPTSSSDFPTTAGAFDSQLDGSSEGWVARVGSDGSLTLATLFGGSGGDVPFHLSVDEGGAPILGGVTDSADFPTTGDGLDTVLDGNSDGFLVRLLPDLTGQSYGTYVGGSAGDVGEAMGASGDGVAALSGTTSSSDFPVTSGAFDPVESGPSESFVTVIDVTDGDGTVGKRVCDPGPPNSTGLPGVLVGEGSDLVSENDLTLVASQLPPGESAVLLVGPGRGGGVAPGGGASQLCVGVPFAADQATAGTVDGSGGIEFPVDLTDVPTWMGSTSVQAGERWSFQTLYSDGTERLLTNAVVVDFQ